MRKLTIPEDVILWDYVLDAPMKISVDGKIQDSPPYTMIKFFEQYIFTDDYMKVTKDPQGTGNGQPNLKARGREVTKTITNIRKAFKGKGVGDEVQVEDANWELVNKILENPGTPWQMHVISQLEVFMEAWQEAKKA